MPFHGIIPGKQAMPLGQIDLLVTFSNEVNFRTENLMFEVADFTGSYHAILGLPCYAKSMAIPNYTLRSSRCWVHAVSSPWTPSSSRLCSASRAAMNRPRLPWRPLSWTS